MGDGLLEVNEALFYFLNRTVLGRRVLFFVHVWFFLNLACPL